MSVVVHSPQSDVIVLWSSVSCMELTYVMYSVCGVLSYFMSVMMFPMMLYNSSYLWVMIFLSDSSSSLWSVPKALVIICSRLSLWLNLCLMAFLMSMRNLFWFGLGWFSFS